MNACSVWPTQFLRTLATLYLILPATLAGLGFVSMPVPLSDDGATADLATRSHRSDPYAPHAGGYALENGTTAEYVGMFGADAKFRAPGKHRFSAAAGVAGPEQKYAPPRMLRSKERVVESEVPPAHAIATVQGESLPRRGLDNLVTFVYGHLQVMQAPRNVTSDSLRRVIVADPAIPAVHVLDRTGKNSFRIMGGRIESASDIAVDAQDNIYIVDSVGGLVLVFDRFGRFVREIGSYHGENLYEHITAIAIDPIAGHLYLTDGPRHLLVMLGLQGNVLKRVGEGWNSSPGQLTRREKFGPGEFDYPTDVAVGGGAVAVLDHGGKRVHIMDLNANALRSFRVQHALKDEAIGMAVDADANVYLSYAGNSGIRVYSPQGKVLGTFGNDGSKAGQVGGPTGLWIDSGNRLYIVDSKNARVELFQLRHGARADCLQPGEKSVTDCSHR